MSQDYSSDLRSIDLNDLMTSVRCEIDTYHKSQKNMYLHLRVELTDKEDKKEIFVDNMNINIQLQKRCDFSNNNIIYDLVKNEYSIPFESSEHLIIEDIEDNSSAIIEVFKEKDKITEDVEYYHHSIDPLNNSLYFTINTNNYSMIIDYTINNSYLLLRLFLYIVLWFIFRIYKMFS